jgi:hypothetical protein
MVAAADILDRLLRDLRRALDGPAIVRDAEVSRLVGEAELAYGKVRLGIVRDERPVPWFVDHLLDDDGEGR